MFEDLRVYIEEIEVMLREIDRYDSFKKQLIIDLKTLNERYSKATISYEKYNSLKQKLLSGKTKKEVLDYYNSYILSLIRKVEYLNTQMFSIIYSCDPYKKHAVLHKHSLTKKIVIEKKADETKKVIVQDLQKLEQVREKPEMILPTEIAKKKPAVNLGTEIIKPDEIKDNPLGALTSSRKSRLVNIGAEHKIDAEKLHPNEINMPLLGMPKPKKRQSLKVPKPKRKNIFSIFGSIFTSDKDEDVKGVAFGSILSFKIIRDVIYRFRQKDDYFSEKTNVGHSLLGIEGVGNINVEKEMETNPNLLLRQASQLRELLKVRNVKIYNPSIIGTLSNLLVRRFTVEVIDSFPYFFKNFYTKLRYANIKILSNTYVNIMVFLSLISFFIFSGISGLILLVQKAPFYLLISKAFLYGSIGAAIISGFMIYYPEIKIKQRKRSINTNLPFIIDHMSSLVASGVSPVTMFRLISQSKEYGEVSLEIEKASNYIDIFGYDLTTSIKSISATTPSPQLKEFFEGFVSTVESGGSLRNYLSQKSQEAMTSYRLERQKYVESISTYSDIYTGVLIAAPLFFVSALSLVSVLGGQVGGYDVETVISFGTYFVIPILNMLFIMFLEMNQPEI